MIARGSTMIVFAPMLVGILIIALSINAASYSLYLLGGFVILISLFLLIFFRDPTRTIGDGVVAPADGRVIVADKHAGRISIFMGIHNVHVNRSPVGGLVQRVEHFKGTHLPASSKDSERNERVIIHLRTKIGKVKIVQIAGIVARRIVPYVRPGLKLKKGQRIGIIRFGSRVDLYLPETVNIITEIGDKVIAGTSQIGAVKHEVD